jgi:hypothetical protein
VVVQLPAVFHSQGIAGASRPPPPR